MRIAIFVSFLVALAFGNPSWSEVRVPEPPLPDARWPEFRGTDGTGAVPDADLPTDLNDPRNLVWQAQPHGRGWSSPVIWGDQLWITTATEDGTRQFALCYNRHTGEKLHDILVFETEVPQEIEPSNSYASCTPVIEEGRVYVHYGSFGTACLDTATGEKLWERRDFPCNHHRGPASSPVLDDQNLYVALDGFDLQYVVALDKQTGATVWKKDRDIDYGTDNGDRMKAYGTGLIFEHQGRRQIVLPSASETISYAPETGEVLWRIRHGGANTAVRPVYRHGLVYIIAGTGPDRMVAVDPSGSGDVTLTHIRWNSGKGIPQRPGPVYVNDRIFMIDDKGVASCRDAINGETIWQTRIGGNYRSSLVCGGDHIFAFDDSGEVTIFKASDQFDEVAKAKFPSGFQASGAIIDDSLYLRSVEGLYCFRKPR